MPRALTSFEYSYIIEKELSPLKGRHLSKIYQLSDNKLRFKIGDRDVTYECGLRLNLSKFLEDGIEKGKFVQFLVKKLDNARLEGISQYNNDRIIIFELSAGNNKYSLIFEMFGEGNAILTSEGKTIAAMKEESWGDREIKHGVEYKFPKSNVKQGVKETLSDKYAIVCLLQLPYGKEYIADVLLGLGIEEKKQGSKLSAEEITKIEHALAKIREEAKPYGFYKDGMITDFSLKRLAKHKDLEMKEFATLSEAVDEYFWHNKDEKDRGVEKLKHRLEEQEKKLEELKIKEEEYKKTGDFIYQNFEKIEEIIKTARGMRLEEIEEKMKQYKPKVNKKEKEIEIEI